MFKKWIKRLVADEVKRQLETKIKIEVETTIGEEVRSVINAAFSKLDQATDNTEEKKDG